MTITLKLVYALAIAFVPLASASCNDYGFPGPAAVCNVTPESDTFLEIQEVVTEDTPGECQANEAPFGGQYYEKARVVYTGVDGIVSTASAINTISDVTPALTGTYSFQFPVPHTAISDDSPVTVNVIYSIPGYGDFATSTSAWTEVHRPTILNTVSTTISTTPFQVFVESTSTLTTSVTLTVTPSTVSSTVVTGTRTIAARAPVTSKTTTITPKPSTVHKTASTTLHKTVSCLPGHIGHQFARDVLQERGGPTYALPNCDPITTTTVYTLISVVFTPSDTTQTDTFFTTVTDSTTITLATMTQFVSIRATTTTTPPTITKTIPSFAPRPTVTKTITKTFLKLNVPSNRPSVCGGNNRQPNAPPALQHHFPFPRR